MVGRWCLHTCRGDMDRNNICLSTRVPYLTKPIPFLHSFSLLLLVGAVWPVSGLISDYCPDCRSNNKIAIMFPSDNDYVGPRISIVGTATPHRICRYVNVYVQDLSEHSGENQEEVNHWRTADTTQTDGKGNWAAVATIKYVTVQGRLRVRAYLSSKPIQLSPCPIDQPIVDGLPSPDITLWRQ